MALVLLPPMLKRQLKYSFFLNEEENRRLLTTVVAHQHRLQKSTNPRIFAKILMVEQEQEEWQGRFETTQCYCNYNWRTARIFAHNQLF